MLRPILIVDDDEFIRDILCTFVDEAFGFPTRCATNGEEALAMIREVLPRLIIMDVRMPGRGGFEVLTELKGAETTRAIPVVMMSAGVGALVHRQALALGADAYSPKPFDFDELETMIRALIR